MRIDHIALNNQNRTLPSRKIDKSKEDDFETEMFDTALNRLKSAYAEKDADKMKQTIDIIMDFVEEGT